MALRAAKVDEAAKWGRLSAGLSACGGLSGRLPQSPHRDFNGATMALRAAKVDEAELWGRLSA